MNWLPWRESLQEDVWQRLGPAKFIVGRRRIDRLVKRAVKRWPNELPQGCYQTTEHGSIDLIDAKGVRALTHSMAETIGQDEFGSIMIMLFIGLASAVVQVLLEWWLTSEDQRKAFAAWKQELR